MTLSHIACSYKSNLLALPRESINTSPTATQLHHFSLQWKMCQTLTVQRQKSSCFLSDRFWQSLCHSFQWEVKMTAAESQWAISPLDTIYLCAFLCTLNQTDRLIQHSLTKIYNNIKQRGSSSIYLSSDNLSPSTEHYYWGWHSRWWTVMGSVWKCRFLFVSKVTLAFARKLHTSGLTFSMWFSSDYVNQIWAYAHTAKLEHRSTSLKMHTHWR